MGSLQFPSNSQLNPALCSLRFQGWDFPWGPSIPCDTNIPWDPNIPCPSLDPSAASLKPANPSSQCLSLLLGAAAEAGIADFIPGIIPGIFYPSPAPGSPGMPQLLTSACSWISWSVHLGVVWITPWKSGAVAMGQATLRVFCVPSDSRESHST